MSSFALSQILIGVAFVCDLASFQFKKREITIALFAIASALISAHFFLLDATTAGFVAATSASRHATSIYSTHRYIKYFWIVILIVVGVVTYESVRDLLPITAGIVATFAVFQLNEKLLRILMAFSTSCFIILNVLVFSPAGVALEVFFLASNLVSYYRFYLRPQSE